MKVLIIVFILTLIGPLNQLRAETSNFHLFSMGTLWKIDLYHPNKALKKEILKNILNKKLQKYDQTFSDWSPSSELRILEKKMESWLTPSPLFMRGLEYSQEAFNHTQKKFDITIGSVLWKEAQKAVGLEKLQMRVKKGSKQFRFLTHPKRLTFGGIVKGMALGRLSQILIKHNIKNFRVDAGGGNISIMGQKNSLMAWEEEIELGALTKDEIVFISRSKLTRPNGTKHIFSRTKTKKSKKFQSVILCKSPTNRVTDWERLASISDALSTVQTFSNIKISQSLNCKKL
ncbi:FAD:protein FMN transferase [Bacteriovoracales bacterium]|nr:FAD:protein FMN transferase [Bacteriovoracales bacterium]